MRAILFALLLAQAAWPADRIQGLSEIASRSGWRRLEDTKRGVVYLSERTVLRDSRTGAIAWRMTSDPAVDANDYYDLPSWNADGSVMSFLSMRGGRKVYWLMDANGSNIRPMPAPPAPHTSSRPVLSGYWSGRYRDRFYQAIEDESGTAITAINPFTGERRVIVKVNRKLGDMQPPHPSEEWFLFGSHPRNNEPDGPSKAAIVGLNGSVQEVSFEKRWHRLRFTKSPDRRIFFNFDEPRTQWTILPDGTGRTSIPDPGGHPDFLPDGSELFYFAPDAHRKSHVWGVRYDGTGKRMIAPFGGHGGPSLDGDWFVADAGAIAVFRTDGSQTSRTLFYHQSSTYSHTDTEWHPDHHTSHPHPCFSPDGTKVIFNSDFLGEYTDVYVAINRFPDPPRDLHLSQAAAALEWRTPARGREIQGYHVYHSAASGVRYERLTAVPAPGTSWNIPAKVRSGYFVITAVEHSGLESRASNEIYAERGEWKGPARLLLEAEAGTAKLPLEEAQDQQTASNGLCMAARDGKPGGVLSVDVTVPKQASYRLWARVKGQGSLNAGQWGVVESNNAVWSWNASAKSVALRAGKTTLQLIAGSGGEVIDKLLLTDDISFVPSGMLALDEQAPPVPSGLKISAVSPNALQLAWTKSSASDLDHYNVYSAAAREFACNRAALLASPGESEFVDWGLPLNSPRWYRITAVDRAGNESAPSPAVRGATADFKPVRIVLKPAAGRMEFMLPREGEYAVWLQSTYEKAKPSAYELSVDEQLSIPWRAWGRWGQPLWTAAGNRITGTPQLFRMAAGNHIFRATPRSKTANASEIVITDDPSWWPVTGMSRLPERKAK